MQFWYICDNAAEFKRQLNNDVDLAIINRWLTRNVHHHHQYHKKLFNAENDPDLGLVVDEDVKFSVHLDHVQKSIPPFIALVWRNGEYIPTAKQRIYTMRT